MKYLLVGLIAGVIGCFMYRAGYFKSERTAGVVAAGIILGLLSLAKGSKKSVKGEHHE